MITMNTLGPQRLCGLVCIHVDDLLGAGNVESLVYQRVVEELKKTFNFREWKESSESEASRLEYCGAPWSSTNHTVGKCTMRSTSRR